MTRDPMTRFHVSLNVTDLDRSISFYSRLFGVQPEKVRTDYAKFEVDDPPVVVALQPGGPVRTSPTDDSPRPRVGHFGLRVSAEKLVEMRGRFTEADMPTRDDGRTVCCYAEQDKFWIDDPDGNEWEVYEFLKDAAQRDGTESSCCS